MKKDVPLGRFVWFDLMTTDQGKAIDFYGKVIGWTTEDFPESPTRYPMWKTADGPPIGGSQELPAAARKSGAPPHWLGYIATPDVDETVKAARKLNAQVLVQPSDIPTVGRFAVLADPQGAVFAIFTPAGETPGHDGRANVGEVSWHELYTSDYEEAFKFYSALFGWTRSQLYDMGEMGKYQLFARNGQDIGGMMNKPEPAMPSAWNFYFRVPDVDAAKDRVTAFGGQVVHGPTEVPGGDLITMVTDPQGAMFAVHEVRS